MSNWEIDDLVGVLKRKWVHASKVRIGDIISTDHGPVQIARIEKLDEFNTFLTGPGYHFFDAYEGGAGGALSEGKQYETHVRIIDRRALDPDALQAQLDSDRAWMKQNS